MDNLSELQEIWRSARTDDLPQAAAVTRMVRKYRSQKLLLVVAVIVGMLLLLAFLIQQTVAYHPAMWSTKIGTICMVTAGLILVAAKISSLVRFYRLKEHSNRDFILFLERTRQRQLFYYKRTQVIGFAICAAGLLLYLYEGVHQKTSLLIGAYAAMIAYLSVLWLYLRRRIFKRQERKLQARIEMFEGLLKQMEV